MTKDFNKLKEFDRSFREADEKLSKIFKSKPERTRMIKTKSRRNVDDLGLKNVDSNLKETIKTVETAAIDIKKTASSIYKIINPNALPKDPEKLIALEKQMVKAEATRIRAKRARENIINMRKEAKARKAYAKKMRRIEREIKVKHIVRLIKNPGLIFKKSENKEVDFEY